MQQELLAKSKAQLNEILTTTPSIHRQLKRTTTTAVATTRRVATQTDVTCDPKEELILSSSACRLPVTKRLQGDRVEDSCNDDSNNNRVSSTEKLKLESQIDSERTAVAALTELGNLHQESSKKSSSSALINHLNSSDSLSVSPVTLHEKLKDMSQLETAAVLMDISKKVIISPPSSNPQSPPHSRVKRTNSSDNNMMMDLSIKRVKVEPTEEAIQTQQQLQQRESVIKTERGRGGGRMDQETMENNEALLNTLKNRHQLNVIKLNDNHSRSLPGLTVLNVDRLNNGIHYAREEREPADQGAEDEEDMDDDSSDPGRLQVDMSMESNREVDEDDLEAHHNNFRNGGSAAHFAKVVSSGYQHQHQQQSGRKGIKPKAGRKNNNSGLDDGRVPSPMNMSKGGITAAQLAASAMASMASAAGGPQDAHGLWHLIAQTTLNNNNGLPMSHQNKEAVQLLQQMIQNKNMQLNLAMPPLNLAALGEMQQPMSLMKVG